MDVYEEGLLAMSSVDFRLECMRRIFRARTQRGRLKREALCREDIVARAALRRADGAREWQRALRTVNEALLAVPAPKSS